LPSSPFQAWWKKAEWLVADELEVEKRAIDSVRQPMDPGGDVAEEVELGFEAGR